MVVIAGGRGGALAGGGSGAGLLAEVGGFGLEELGAEITLGAGGAALACLAVLELEVGGEGDLVVAGATEGFAAAGLDSS